MTTADLDVIKEIPGYKVILRAVLKSQIQQLVTQLAASTDEESVILTASVSDGTLSHLGSESGKDFLENHEDIKSQFLGFCLRSHHKKKQEEKERQAAELLQQSTQSSPGVYPTPAGPFTPESPSFSFLSQRSVHPVALTRVSPRTHIRPPGVRHVPYTLVRPPRRNSQNIDTSPAKAAGSSAETGPVIKTEPSDNSAISNQSESDTISQDVSEQLKSQQNKPEVSISLEPGITDDNASSDCSVSTFPNESFTDGQNVDSDGANVTSGNTQQNCESEDVDTNVSIKLEEIDEDEMDLEIIGVEPGKPAESKDNWDSNVSMGMNFDAIGATGNQGDMAAQGYIPLHFKSTFTNVSPVFNDIHHSCNFGQFGVDSQLDLVNRLEKQKQLAKKSESKQALLKYNEFFKIVDIAGATVYICTFSNCEKIFKEARDLLRHILTHTKEKPYACKICDCKFSRKDRLRAHEINHGTEGESFS